MMSGLRRRLAEWLCPEIFVSERSLRIHYEAQGKAIERDRLHIEGLKRELLNWQNEAEVLRDARDKLQANNRLLLRQKRSLEQRQWRPLNTKPNNK